MVRERSFNSYLLKIAFILITVFLVLVALVVLVQPAPAQNPTFTVLHTFTGVDGASPSASLILDEAGSLYGTTEYGGCCIYLGMPFWGTVFKLDQAGKEKVLHSFTRQGWSKSGIHKRGSGRSGKPIRHNSHWGH